MLQPIHTPDQDAQRAAMMKLSFLAGKWSGEARMLRASGEPLEMLQTEEVQFKLDGLLLAIEGIGRAKSGQQTVLQALGLISYDDAAGAYRMRAFNDGRWLETEVQLADNNKQLTWGFSVGEARTRSLLCLNERGDWTELHEITIGNQPPRKLMELTVRRQE